MTYELRNFEVVRNHNGKFEIIKHEPWYRTTAVDDLWCPLNYFDSFIKAVKYLKENINNIY